MIYISGAVTDTNDYQIRFENAEETLKNCGYEDIINPVKITANLPKNTPYKRYIDITLECLRDCDSIYMLNDWKKSKGARLEHAYAECAGMKIIYEKDVAKPEEKKYYWKLKGNFVDDTFLGYGRLSRVAWVNTCHDMEFTESEYKELSKKFSFPEDMFVKEENE